MKYKKRMVTNVVSLVLFLWLASAVFAQEQTTNYSGDFWSRSTLTGDWGGVRNEWAKKGVTFDLSLTQIGQGIVSGGKDVGWEYGGRGDLILNLDTQKMGLWPGGFFMVEVEGNFGNAVNSQTGALMPVNTNQLFPLPGGHGVALPVVTYTQFFSEQFGVMVGKLPVMAADDNAFAHGKGDTQFMNVALNVVPLALFTAPYTPLGAIAIILPTKNPAEAMVKFATFTSTGKADSAGWDTINGDKVTFWGEGRVRTGFFGMTGHQLLGGLYSNRDFTSIDQRISLDPAARQIAKKSDSWAVYYNFDQYLYEPVKGSGKGFGIFGRFSVADGNPNFLHYFYSIGAGGKGVIPGRPVDEFGIGYYYMDVSNPTFTGPLGGTASFLRDEQGFEAYYNFAITPWIKLTPDIQIIRPAQKDKLSVSSGPPPVINKASIDTATVLGLRLQVIF